MKTLHTMMQEHSELVAALKKPSEAIKEEMTADKADLIHMAMGIAGEAGELLDAIKKFAVYGKDLDMKNVIEELGDIEFYMEGMREVLGIGRMQILGDNIIKLNKRYSSGSYSDQQAQARADKA